MRRASRARRDKREAAGGQVRQSGQEKEKEKEEEKEKEKEKQRERERERDKMRTMQLSCVSTRASSSMSSSRGLSQLSCASAASKRVASCQDKRSLQSRVRFTQSVQEVSVWSYRGRPRLSKPDYSQSRASQCTTSAVRGVSHERLEHEIDNNGRSNSNVSRKGESLCEENDIEVELDWKKQRSQAERRLAEISRQRNEDLKRYRSQRATSAADRKAQSGGCRSNQNDNIESPSFPAMASLENHPLVLDDGMINGTAARSENARAAIIAILNVLGTNDLSCVKNNLEVKKMKLMYVGVTRNASTTLRSIVSRVPQLLSERTVFKVVHVRRPSKSLLDAARLQWINEAKQEGNTGESSAAVDNRIDMLEMWEKPLECFPLMTTDEKQAIDAATNVLAKDRLTKEACRRIEAGLKKHLEEIGVTEKLRYDPKLKARGLLDLTAACAKKS